MNNEEPKKEHLWSFVKPPADAPGLKIEFNVGEKRVSIQYSREQTDALMEVLVAEVAKQTEREPTLRDIAIARLLQGEKEPKFITKHDVQEEIERIRSGK